MRIEELETPAIVVDLDIVERNLRRMSNYAAQHKIELRPHTKTHKTPELAKAQLAAGSRGVTVAKTGEAEVMADAGIEDILVHYPVYGESKAERLAQLAHRCRLTVAVDAADTAELLARAASRAGSTIRILVELDTGMRRCGVSSAKAAAELGAKVSALAGLELVGVTTYPGHIREKPALQVADVVKVGDLLSEAADLFDRKGLKRAVVSGGSTPTAANSHLTRSLTEMRPGTYIFNDRNTLGSEACSLGDCALQVIVTIVSTAVQGRSVIDGGSKTFTSDRWTSGSGGHGLIVAHPEVKFAAMSEEHGMLDVGGTGWEPRIGERVAIVPNHVCPCVNLHDTIHYHRQGIVEGTWSIAARGKVR